MKKITALLLFVFVLFFGICFSLFPANIAITNFELMTHGKMTGGSFGLNTRGNIDLLIEGGYKFGGSIVFNLENNDLEDVTSDRNLKFKSAGVTIREIFGLPLDINYFTGETDVFASGDDFPTLFGSEPIATYFRGFSYFPTGILYDGIYTVSGTGFKISTSTLRDWLNLSVYLYQDGAFGTGTYSSDIRSLFNFEKFKMETFIGASFPKSDYGLYRGGFLLFYNTGMGGEFLTEIGIPRWDPAVGTDLTIDQFYFLFEPRVRLNIMSIILTLFWHPEYYDQQVTDELGSIDINTNFLFGDIRRTTMSGGFENTIQFRSGDAEDQLKIGLAPYLSLNTSGVIWDFKIRAKLFPFDLDDLVEGFIGIRTEF